MALTQTTTVETTVTLAPAVQAQLEATLSTYNELKVQRDLLSEQMDEEKTAMFDIMEENHIEALRVGKQPLRIVRGVTSSLDQKKMRADGITDAQIANWTTTKPKKAYLDIRGSDDAT